MEPKLNERHKLFVEEYLSNGLNGTQAYMKVYGTKENTANVNSSKLLSNANIKAAIENAQKVTCEKLNITKESLLLDLIKIKDLCVDDKRYVHNAIKAVETMSKMLGYFAPTETNTTLSTNFKLADLIKFKDEKQ